MASLQLDRRLSWRYYCVSHMEMAMVAFRQPDAVFDAAAGGLAGGVGRV